MSPRSRWGSRSVMVSSTAPAGTIIQTTRGVDSLDARSAAEVEPTAVVSFTSAAIGSGERLYTTHWWPPFSSRRTMLAPMRPRPIIPSCTEEPSFARAARHWASSGLPSQVRSAGVLEDVDEFAVAPGDLGDGLVPRRPFRPPRNERIPEIRAPDCEADKARNAGGDREPFANLLVVLAAPKHDAAHPLSPTGPSRGHDPRAIFAPIEALDLPDIRLDAGRLQLLDGDDHQPWPEFGVVSGRIALHPLELIWLRGHQQFEHEPTAVRPGQVVGKLLQPSRLHAVEGLIALGVEAHQHLAKGRSEGLDVPGEVFAVLELELVLAALLRWRGGDETGR